VRETDMNKISQSYMQSVKKNLKGLYHYQQALNIDKYFNILKFAPGMEEYAAWLALEACYDETHFDHIIIDTPPTALTMKTLALSSVNLLWLRQLETMRKEIIEKKNSVGRIRKENLDQLDDDPVYIRLQKMKTRYEKMLRELQDRERTEIVLILNEDELSFSESIQIKEDLTKLGISIARVIINKGEISSIQTKAIAREFVESEIHIIEDYGQSITGIDDLKEHSQQIQRVEKEMQSATTGVGIL
jgi:arsenite-transporting ATPase